MIERRWRVWVTGMGLIEYTVNTVALDVGYAELSEKTLSLSLIQAESGRLWVHNL